MEIDLVALENDLVTLVSGVVSLPAFRWPDDPASYITEQMTSARGEVIVGVTALAPLQGSEEVSAIAFEVAVNVFVPARRSGAEHSGVLEEAARLLSLHRQWVRLAGEDFKILLRRMGDPAYHAVGVWEWPAEYVLYDPLGLER